MTDLLLPGRQRCRCVCMGQPMFRMLKTRSIYVGELLPIRPRSKEADLRLLVGLDEGLVSALPLYAPGSTTFFSFADSKARSATKLKTRAVSSAMTLSGTLTYFARPTWSIRLPRTFAHVCHSSIGSVGTDLFTSSSKFPGRMGDLFFWRRPIGRLAQFSKDTTTLSVGPFLVPRVPAIGKSFG